MDEEAFKIVELFASQVIVGGVGQGENEKEINKGDFLSGVS